MNLDQTLAINFNVKILQTGAEQELFNAIVLHFLNLRCPLKSGGK